MNDKLSLMKVFVGQKLIVVNSLIANIIRQSKYFSVIGAGFDYVIECIILYIKVEKIIKINIFKSDCFRQKTIIGKKYKFFDFKKIIFNYQNGATNRFTDNSRSKIRSNV